jgi:hypothetical protein
VELRRSGKEMSDCDRADDVPNAARPQRLAIIPWAEAVLAREHGDVRSPTNGRVR